MSVDSLSTRLKAALGEDGVREGMLERLARARDASIYRMVPRVVVRPRTVADVRAVFQVARENQIGVTFRAGGTSLSGQAVTDGILAELGPFWRNASVSEDGTRITSEPGVTGGRLNAMLSHFHRRIGPDPASLAACQIGGIVANNASGMCCGTENNAYRTLTGLKILLADGYELDTRLPTAGETLERERPQLHRGLLDLRRRIWSNPALLDRLRAKYALKNTMGYSLNSFVDFERPVDILEHLLVGSEGTLGFLAEVTLRTIPECVHQATALAYFRDLPSAGAAVEPLARAGAAVLEIMDYSSMAALQAEMKYPFALSPGSAALLVEFQQDSAPILAERLAEATGILSGYDLLAPPEFTHHPEQRAHYWKLRKGLFPKIGGERELGTAVIIEDICVPRRHLAAAITDLRALFQTHGFSEAVIFGHAKDGNLHFVLCNDFSKKAAITRYAALMEGLSELVVKRYDGSLKAEHGTGRNMAPFVKFEWGEELYEIMRAVKRLLDPDGILNPGVLLTEDRNAHLRHLKTLAPVAARADRCIECGFCERVCPSRDLSLSPRQRIAIQREIAHWNTADPKLARQLRREYEYAGIETCAGDGLCATVCPVDIDTGAYMRELKASRHGALANRSSLFVARHLGWFTSVARMGLRLLRFWSSLGLAVPGWPARLKLPRPGRAPALVRRGAHPDGAELPRVVYFSACLGAMMRNPGPEDPDAAVKALRLCGYDVIPAGPTTRCCGQAFASKAFFPAARAAAEGWIGEMWRISDGGRYPIICDTSPCTARLHGLGEELDDAPRTRWRQLAIYDFHSFMARQVLPRKTSWPKLPRRLVLHPTCSSIKHDTVKDLLTLARTFATEVTIPVSAGCCGFAGDKGFRVPELTESATREEAREVQELVHSVQQSGQTLFGYSTCQTCALGMSASTGIAYQSIAQLCLDALQGGVPA